MDSSDGFKPCSSFLQLRRFASTCPFRYQLIHSVSNVTLSCFTGSRQRLKPVTISYTIPSEASQLIAGCFDQRVARRVRSRPEAACRRAVASLASRDGALSSALNAPNATLGRSNTADAAFESAVDVSVFGSNGVSASWARGQWVLTPAQSSQQAALHLTRSFLAAEDQGENYHGAHGASPLIVGFTS
jgi:hypothetical protein